MKASGHETLDSHKTVLAQLRHDLAAWHLPAVWAAFEKALQLKDSPANPRLRLSRREFVEVFGIAQAAELSIEDAAVRTDADDSALEALLAKHDAGAADRSAASASDPEAEIQAESGTAGPEAASAAAEASPSSSAPARLPLFAHKVLAGADGHVRLFDVFTMLLLHCQGDLRQRCAFMWRIFDMDQNGKLDREEVLAFFDAACSALHKLEVLPSRPNIRQLRALRRDLFASVDANEDGVLSFPEVYRWAASSSHTRELMDGFGVAALDDDDPRKIEVVTRRARLVRLERQAIRARKRCRRWSAPAISALLDVSREGTVVRRTPDEAGAGSGRAPMEGTAAAGADAAASGAGVDPSAGKEDEFNAEADGEADGDADADGDGGGKDAESASASSSVWEPYRPPGSLVGR